MYRGLKFGEKQYDVFVNVIQDNAAVLIFNFLISSFLRHLKLVLLDDYAVHTNFLYTHRLFARDCCARYNKYGSTPVILECRRLVLF